MSGRWTRNRILVILQEHARLALLKYNPARQVKNVLFTMTAWSNSWKLNRKWITCLPPLLRITRSRPTCSLRSMQKRESSWALRRWYGGISRKREWSHPSEFIPFFESNGKICQLDLCVPWNLKQLSTVGKKWESLYSPSLQICPDSILQRTFFGTFFQTAQEYGIPDNILEFELTESIFFESREIHHVKQIIGDSKWSRLSVPEIFGSGFFPLAC